MSDLGNRDQAEFWRGEAIRDHEASTALLVRALRILSGTDENPQGDVQDIFNAGRCFRLAEYQAESGIHFAVTMQCRRAAR